MKTQTQFTPSNIHRKLNEVGPWSFFYLSEIAFKYYYRWYVGLYEMNTLAAIRAMSKYEPDLNKLIKRFQKEVGYKAVCGDEFNDGCVNRY